MDLSVITKSYLETHLQRGDFFTFYESDNPLWQTETSKQAIGAVVQEILNNFSEIQKAQIYWLLRAIIVSNELKETVAFLGEQLQENGILTDNEVTRAAAKTIPWGGDEFENLYVVIIIDEIIIAALLDDTSDLYNTSKRFLVHEFVHVFTTLHSRRIRKKLVDTTCKQVLFQLVDVLWSETEAERLANEFVPDNSIEDALSLCLQLIELGTKIIRQAIHEFKLSNDMTILFDIAGEQLSVIIAQIGRCLGCLLAQQENNLDEFVKLLYIKDALWGETTSQILEIYKEKTIGVELYRKLSEVIKGYFHAVGLFPECREDGFISLGVFLKT